MSFLGRTQADIGSYERESYAHDTLTAPKTGTRKPVPVSDAPDMQFGTDEFFW